MACETIYDIYEDGEYIGSYNSSEICHRLKITKNTLYAAAVYGSRINGRFVISAADKAIGRKDRIWAEFDRTVTEVSEQLERWRRA